MAVKRALEYAVQHNFFKINIIESDSLKVIKYLQSSTTMCSYYLDNIRGCQQLYNFFLVVEFSHVRKRDNRVAHANST